MTDLINEVSGRPGAASVQSTRGEYLVALERTRAEPPATYYFPQSLVVTGLAGDIALQDGDGVQVVDIRDTSLNPVDVLAGYEHRVQIRGYVREPRVEEGIAFISGIHREADSQLTDHRRVWMLERPAEAGARQKRFRSAGQLCQCRGTGSELADS